MNPKRLFDHSHGDGILNPTHGKGHLFSDEVVRNFLNLINIPEYEENVFEVHDPILKCDISPIRVQLINGKIKSMRRSITDMIYDHDEFVYAIPIKENNSNIEYHCDNLLIIGTWIDRDYSLDFMGMMKTTFDNSDLKVLSTKEWNVQTWGCPKELELTVCDKNNDAWKVKFG